MYILSINCGSYSVKFLEVKLERKRFTILDFAEIIIPTNSFGSNFEIYHNIIKEYIDTRKPEGKIIYQLPNNMLTTRYIQIPVNNKKKAEMMLPFQLDENLPFPVSNAHYTTYFHKEKNNISTLISISKQNEFEDFYTSMENKNITTSIVTSEIHLIQNFLDNGNITSPVCFIDLGHTTTKFYFAINKKIKSNHTSYIAGSTITEIISQNYQISHEDATIYKHQNCFFLTALQYENADEEQRNFATIMKQTFSPLISLYKRWELAFKVHHNVGIEKIYLLGGSSNISNITNFFEEEMGPPIEYLISKNILNKNSSSDPEPNNNIYTTNLLMARSQAQGNTVPNFLSGSYSANVASNIPIYSTVFLGSRIYILAAIVLITLLIENIILSNHNDKITRTVKKVLKSKKIGLTNKEQARLIKHPNKILTKLTDKNNKIDKSISKIKKIDKIGAVSHFIKMGQYFNQFNELKLNEYKGDNINIFVKFNTSNNDIKSIKERILLSDLKNLNLTQDKDKHTFTIKYQIR